MDEANSALLWEEREPLAETLQRDSSGEHSESQGVLSVEGRPWDVCEGQADPAPGCTRRSQGYCWERLSILGRVWLGAAQCSANLTSCPCLLVPWEMGRVSRPCPELEPQRWRRGQDLCHPCPERNGTGPSPRWGQEAVTQASTVKLAQLCC